jgi:uncharacterized OB-fold protein
VSQASFRPSPSAATRPYWDATRERRLLLQWCPTCRIHVHHPREACPRCLGQDLTWVESQGHGALHAVSVHHRPFGALSMEDCPYVVAFVDLDDGVRFLANVVEADLGRVEVGDRVELAWVPVADGYHLPAFRPAERQVRGHE